MLWPDLSLRNRDMFTDMRRLQGEMNRLFSGFGLEKEDYPAVNVWTNSEEAIVAAEVPGVDAEKININVLHNQLTIEGESKSDVPADDVVCHRAERGSGKFARTIRLPFDVESDNVSASYQKGILKIILPRAEASKPKKISIVGE